VTDTTSVNVVVSRSAPWVLRPGFWRSPQRTCLLQKTLHAEFILVVNQLDAQNLFYNKFISCLYMFRAYVLIVRRSKLCAHRQVNIVFYSLWYHHTL